MKDSLDKQATTLSELLKIIATRNLKFKHMTSRIEEAGNGAVLQSTEMGQVITHTIQTPFKPGFFNSIF